MVNSSATGRWLTGEGKLGMPQLAYPIAPPYEPMDRIGSESDPLRLLLMGRVNGHKGHLEAVCAAQAARDAGEQVELTLLGGAFSGQEQHLAALLAVIKDLPWVHYGGEVTEPREFFRRCDVVLIPTTRPEPFGLVAVEAWAAGRRVIASDQGGLAEAATMVEGLLVSAADVADLCQAIVRAAHEPAIRAAPLAGAPVSELCTLAARELAWKAGLGRAGHR
jgi:glycosyltransferase involved in cell wall biosynthesis